MSLKRKVYRNQIRNEYGNRNLAKVWHGSSYWLPKSKIYKNAKKVRPKCERIKRTSFVWGKCSIFRRIFEWFKGHLNR